jgi:hypothetical protein
MADDAPYQQSRAALRRIYGTRRIDASAPQAAQDGTPSGRERRAVMAGATPAGAVRKATEQFRSEFNPLPAVPVGRPMGWSRSIAQQQDTGLPGTIRGDIQSGAVTGSYPVPQYNGSVGFSMTPPQPTPLNYPLTEPSPVGAETLAPYLPTTPKPTGYVPPWRKQQTPGIMSTVLNGAAKWLT